MLLNTCGAILNLFYLQMIADEEFLPDSALLVALEAEKHEGEEPIPQSCSVGYKQKYEADTPYVILLKEEPQIKLKTNTQKAVKIVNINVLAAGSYMVAVSCDMYLTWVKSTMSLALLHVVSALS